jgi:signal transduction histidine kinase
VTERWRLDLPGLDPATAAIVESRVECRLAALERAHADAERQLAAVRAENGVLRSVVDALADRVEADRAVTEGSDRAALARQSQKLEAVGLLAGGVAHDFNNLLTVILGNAAIASETLPPDAPVRDELDEILDAARRGAALTRQLLAFGRQQAIEPTLVDLHQAARDAGRLLGRLVGVDARLVLDEGGGLARVYADPGHVAQVIMNLVVNARDAMPDGGTITVTTRGGVSLPPDAPPPEPSTLPGAAAVRLDAARGALLAVRDTGTGMSPATRERAFEPFFTTKSVGQGTGLGLATVYGIVRQAGGTVWIESAEARGTTVSVWLPGAVGPT